MNMSQKFQMCQPALGCIEISKISDRKLKDSDLKQELWIKKQSRPRGDGAKEAAEQIRDEDVREKREVRAQWQKWQEREERKEWSHRGWTAQAETGKEGCGGRIPRVSGMG